jgi:hypothetical protein
MTEKYEKILFRFYSNIFDEEMVETMWAIVIDENKGLFKLDNIPFYAPLIASDDLIFAEYDESEQMLTYRKTVEYSGNSLIQVVIMDKNTDTNSIRNSFKDLGCQSEKVNEGYFSIEIPSNLNYKPIKYRLDELQGSDIIGYAEPCLSEIHRLQIKKLLK